jgi:hypothetical protein
MDSALMTDIVAGIKSGRIVPYLGPATLTGSVSKENGAPIPADSDSLILAMNNGQPMAPKLMYEFPRAAMNLELKRGRPFISKFLTKTYGETEWSRAPIHDWLASIKPNYVIDINRDTQLQDSYSNTAHTLIVGISRVAGTDYRFNIYHYDGKEYTPVEQDKVDTALPILFKPMGTPTPEPNYIASDADYVDYITELMGGFAIPSFLKTYRKGKQYLFMGMRMTRDTERMVLSDISYDSDDIRGWALIPEANDKEKRFCKKMGIEIIDADCQDLLDSAGFEAASGVGEDVAMAGC